MSSNSAPDNQQDIRLDPQHPWPGLVSFSEANSAFFYGRDREIAELARMVRQDMLTVFFGKSGLGKSSILRAGFAPRIRDDNFVPIYIRLNHAEETLPLEDQVEIFIERTLDEKNIDGPRPVRRETLWEYFHKKNSSWWDVNNNLVKPVLIFDQFEELLTIGQETPDREARSAAFLTELEDLVENKPPQELLERFSRERGLAAKYDLERTDYRVVLTLREDFLPDLEGLRERLRLIMRNRFRLLQMSGEHALEVILKPGEGLVDEDTALRIVDFVSSSERSRLNRQISRKQISRRQVEPALLSVVLQELNNRRLEKGAQKISIDLDSHAEAAEILTDFYERSLEDMDDAVRDFMVDNLLTSSGARNRIAEEDALSKDGISSDVIARLIDRRILQREMTGNVRWLELTHDVLADVVRASRDEHLRRRAAAASAARMRRAGIAATVFIVVLTGIAAGSLYLLNRAQQNLELAQGVADRFAVDIAHVLESTESIATSDKAFFVKELTYKAKDLLESEESADLQERTAEVFATGALMLFERGQIDEAVEYATNAHTALSSASAQADSAGISPYTGARVQLAAAIRHLYQENTRAAHSALDAAEAYLANPDAADGTSPGRLAVLKAQIEKTRVRILLDELRVEEAHVAAKAARAWIKEQLENVNVNGEEAEATRRALYVLLFEVHALRERFYDLIRIGDITDIREDFHNDLVRAEEDAIFPEVGNPVWRYHNIRYRLLEAQEQATLGHWADATDNLNVAVDQLAELLSTDPRNLHWRYVLADAILDRVWLSMTQEDRRQAKADLQAARALSLSMKRDQQNRYHSARIDVLADFRESSVHPEKSPAIHARMLARVEWFRSLTETGLRHSDWEHFAHKGLATAAFEEGNADKAAGHFQKAAAALDAIEKTSGKTRFLTLRRIHLELRRIDMFSEALRTGYKHMTQEDWEEFHGQARANIVLLQELEPDSVEALSRKISILRWEALRHLHQENFAQAVMALEEAAEIAQKVLSVEPGNVTILVDSIYVAGNRFYALSLAQDWKGFERLAGQPLQELFGARPGEPLADSVQSALDWFTKDLDHNVSRFKDSAQTISESDIRIQRDEIDIAASVNSTTTKKTISDNRNRRIETAVASLKGEIQQLKTGHTAGNVTTAEQNGFDLRQLELGELVTGATSGDTVTLVSEPLSWPSRSGYPGPWRTLAGDVLKQAKAHFSGKYFDVLKVRSTRLPFYADGILIEAELVDRKSERSMIGIRLIVNGEVYNLNGTSPPIHEANAQGPVELHTEDQVAAYLRLFTTYVRGSEGAFQIVENAENLHWSVPPTREQQRLIGRLLRPLVVWPDPEASGTWRATAAIQYSNAIFHAEFRIQKSGMIEMLEDSSVAEDLPVELPMYDEKTGRRLDVPKRLDMESLGVENINDEILGLLGLTADMMRSRSDRRYEFAHEAALLQVVTEGLQAGKRTSEVLSKAFAVLYIWGDDPERACVYQEDILPRLRIDFLEMEPSGRTEAVKESLINQYGRLARACLHRDDKKAFLERLSDELISLIPDHPASYINASWSLLVAGNNKKALIAANAGLELDKNQWAYNVEDSIKMNLQRNRAHALLLLDRVDEALEIYERNKGLMIAEDLSWEQQILKDLDNLREYGIEHEQFVAVRRLMQD